MTRWLAVVGMRAAFLVLAVCGIFFGMVLAALLSLAIGNTGIALIVVFGVMMAGYLFRPPRKLKGRRHLK